MYGRLLQSSVEKMIDSAQTKAMSYCNDMHYNVQTI